MGVPHEFWANAILTSTFLINRLPSTPLGGEVPLRRLHPDRELFSLPPRVFGCVAFAQDHSANKSKLAPRAVRGLFVGYSRTQKGYCIYLPHDRRYIISEDFTFHESTRYFTTTTSSWVTPASPPQIPIASVSSNIPELPLPLPSSPFTLSLTSTSPPRLLPSMTPPTNEPPSSSPLPLPPLDSITPSPNPTLSLKKNQSATSSSTSLTDDLHLPIAL